MRLGFAFVVVTALAGSGQALAQEAIQKCVGADGEVTYQDTACSKGTKRAGQISRDTRMADPGALQRAREDQERADRNAERRTRIELAEAELRARQVPEPVAAEPINVGEPYYSYVGATDSRFVPRERPRPFNGTLITPRTHPRSKHSAPPRR